MVRAKDIVTAVLIAVILMMQAVTARHYGVHFNSDAHLAAYKTPQHSDHEKGQDTADALCPICLFLKNCSETLTSSDSVLLQTAVYAPRVTNIPSAPLILFESISYLSRAPPVAAV